MRFFKSRHYLIPPGNKKVKPISKTFTLYTNSSSLQRLKRVKGKILPVDFPFPVVPTLIPMSALSTGEVILAIPLATST